MPFNLVDREVRCDTGGCKERVKVDAGIGKVVKVQIEKQGWKYESCCYRCPKCVKKTKRYEI